MRGEKRPETLRDGDLRCSRQGSWKTGAAWGGDGRARHVITRLRGFARGAALV